MASGRGSESEQRVANYALVNQDSVERIDQVIRSLSAYRGHLTRLYNEIETLFPNFESHVVALERKSTLDGLFARYNAKAKELLYLVGCFRQI